MKILLAVDGSENSLRAAEQALKLARLNQEVQVTALYVGPSCYDLFPEPGVCAWIQQKELDKEIETRAAAALDKVKEIFQPAGVPLQTAVERGDSGKAICRLAEEKGFDLVIMGSRGHGDLANVFLGSVSHKVLHTCRLPVMIVK
ncbi:universal stress protein [Desulfotomaculum copahuensis]|uniref:Universal stress protein UspA n=1 Tax=Desulfotomaculum copahuensis TaxID=1838280 RepID=A0A1B7LCI6_9FIRM|nr:universal stress protein [Desulfotomaculum copahuensis]OAT80433.1 universal stress protein UspA [Desulfotomaculum copahuensis]